jgi:hypothetical protein
MVVLRTTDQVTAAEAGLSEEDIERFISEKPEVLNLGQIRILSSQIRQVHGGILDLLAFQQDTNTYFEIEVTRGQVDHWHIAHILDYWAREQQERRFSYHVPVLVAESSRGRFRILLSTLPVFLPLIVMEMRIMELDNSGAHSFRCEPIYYPDNVKMGIENKLWVKKSSDYFLASKTSMLLIGHLLSDHGMVSKTMRDISDSTGISLGAVANVVRALSQEGFIQQKGKRRKLVNIDGLRERFADVARAFPDRIEYISDKSALNVDQLMESI